MHSVIAHHGTTDDRLQSILTNGFKPTKRDASWLGFGIYFTYRAPLKAKEYAIQAASRPSRNGERPVIIEARVDLSNMLNLLDSNIWPLVKLAYQQVDSSIVQVGPGYRFDPEFTDTDKVGWNRRDCEAMNILVGMLEKENKQVDSIIAAFSEGEPMDESSWLYDQSAVILNVLNPTRIAIISYEILELD